MFVSSKDLNRTAELSGRVAETARRLLDLARTTTDAATKQSMLDRAKEMLEISRDLFVTIDHVAQANSSPQSIFSDMDPSLRRVLEQIGREKV